MNAYRVRRVYIGTSEQLDTLARECGRLYSQTLVFFASLKSWRERKKAGDPDAKPPHRRKWYFRIEYKRSAMLLADGRLRLPNGKGNAPLMLSWPWELPQTVVIRWTGTQYEAIATYAEPPVYGPFLLGKAAGIDLGEVHMAAAYDGTETHILNGRANARDWRRA